MLSPMKLRASGISRNISRLYASLPCHRNGCAWVSTIARRFYGAAGSQAVSADIKSLASRHAANSDRQVTAHIIGLAFNNVGLRGDLESIGASSVHRDNFTLIERCPKIGHEEGPIFIGNNGLIVLWGAANGVYPAYRQILEKNIRTPVKLPRSTLSDLSESMDIKEGETTCILKGAVHLSKDCNIAEKLAISLALMSAVQLNHMELSIRLNLMISNDVLDRLRSTISKKSLDKLTERLFEFQTYAHRTRYWLNLEYDPLEIPDILWDNENLCTLFMATQATFDLPQRLEKLNNRISWELDSLQSHSEYIRHKHSSRLEKIIILVITFELALGLCQALYKLF